MNMIDILNVLLTPEVLALLLTIILALLLKSKVLSEQDIASAKELLTKYDATVSEVTDKTRLVASEVEKIKEEIKPPAGAPDTNRKKVQRAARAILRGWLRF